MLAAVWRFTIFPIVHYRNQTLRLNSELVADKNTQAA
jgi:hypothetical protein